MPSRLAVVAVAVAAAVAIAVAVVVVGPLACGVDGPQPRPPTADHTGVRPLPGGAGVPVDAVHHELVRIEQPFHPNDDYAIVIDAWVASGTLVDVRMGWVDTGAGDARSRFGKGVRRHVDVEHVQPEPRSWRISLVSGDVRRHLAITLDRDDRPAVWATIDAQGGACLLYTSLPSGPYAKREFLVVRLRPWWSRAGIKIVAYFGVPPRAGVRAGVGARVEASK